MNDVFSEIEYDEGEQILWQGKPQQAVSPTRWWYLFIASALLAAACAASFTIDTDIVVRALLALLSIIAAIFPFLLTRSVNGAQYLATDRRLIICEPTLTGAECESYGYDELRNPRLTPLHNGLASLHLTCICEEQRGVNGAHTVRRPILLHAIPAAVAEALAERVGS